MKSYRVKFLIDLGEALEDGSRIYSNDPFEPRTKEEKGQIEHCFEMMEKACTAFHLPIVGKSYGALAKDLPTEPSLFWFVYNQFQELMETKTLFYATDDAKALYSQPSLFGAAVDKAFPSGSDDLRDGGSCLALGQPNAAVFHFLRAMEVPLKALASEFGVKKFKDWNSALVETEEAVRNPDNPKMRPNWANEKDYFTDMIPFLFTVKNAWRNYTMHLKIRHTDEEAREIMAAAKSFMQRAAKRLKE